MFEGCDSLESLNLHGWDLSSLRGGGYSNFGLASCHRLRTLDLGGVKINPNWTQEDLDYFIQSLPDRNYNYLDLRLILPEGLYIDMSHWKDHYMSKIRTFGNIRNTAGIQCSEWDIPVTLDFSVLEGLPGMFRKRLPRELPEDQITDWYWTFYGNQELSGEFTLPRPPMDKDIIFTNTFRDCHNLEKLIIPSNSGSLNVINSRILAGSDIKEVEIDSYCNVKRQTTSMVHLRLNDFSTTKDAPLNLKINCPRYSEFLPGPYVPSFYIKGTLEQPTIIEVHLQSGTFVYLEGINSPESSLILKFSSKFIILENEVIILKKLRLSLTGITSFDEIFGDSNRSSDNHVLQVQDLYLDVLSIYGANGSMNFDQSIFISPPRTLTIDYSTVDSVAGTFRLDGKDMNGMEEVTIIGNGISGPSAIIQFTEPMIGLKTFTVQGVLNAFSGALTLYPMQSGCTRLITDHESLWSDSSSLSSAAIDLSFMSSNWDYQNMMEILYELPKTHPQSSALKSRVVRIKTANYNRLTTTDRAKILTIWYSILTN